MMVWLFVVVFFCGVGVGGGLLCCSLHFITCVHLRNQMVTQWIDFLYIYTWYIMLWNMMSNYVSLWGFVCVCVFLLGASGHPELTVAKLWWWLFSLFFKSISQHVSKIFQTASFYPPFILCPFTLILVTLTQESLNWKLCFLNNFLANQFCTVFVPYTD